MFAIYLAAEHNQELNGVELGDCQIESQSLVEFRLRDRAQEFSFLLLHLLTRPPVQHQHSNVRIYGRE